MIAATAAALFLAYAVVSARVAWKTYALLSGHFRGPRHRRENVITAIIAGLMWPMPLALKTVARVLRWFGSK